MKPLTKTVVSRGGGIAARFVPKGTKSVIEDVQIIDGGSTFVAKVKNAKTTTTNTVRFTVKELAKLRKRGLLTDTVADKPRYERWREANPELYKERQAAYMRKRRAKEKAKQPSSAD